jgi:hypothetical protein
MICVQCPAQIVSVSAIEHTYCYGVIPDVGGPQKAETNGVKGSMLGHFSEAAKIHSIRMTGGWKQ